MMRWIHRLGGGLGESDPNARSGESEGRTSRHALLG